MAELLLEFFIWLLSIMAQPLAVSQAHFRKDRFKRRIFWRAGINTEMNLTTAFM